MGPIETVNNIEAHFWTELRNRGWTVFEGQRDGVDLDLSVAFGRTRGVIRFRNAFGVDAHAAATTTASPIYVRVDLGEPAGPPLRWAVWDRYEFPKGKHAARYRALLCHEAIGDSWASVAGCSLSPKGPWLNRYRATEMLLSRAEALDPARDGASRRAQIFAAQRENFGAQTPRGSDIVTVVILLGFASFLGTVGGFAFAAIITNAMTDTDRAAALVLAFLMFGVPFLVCGIIGFVKLIQLFRGPKTPVDGMAAIVQTLRNSGAFTELSPTPRKDREGLPVAVGAGRHRTPVRAALSLSRLAATASTHPVTLEADVCRLAWPEGTVPAARFVPDHWLTTDLAGDETHLAKLPTGPREERREGLVRWTFTGSEIDAGDVAEHFRKVAAALGVAGGPAGRGTYR